MFDHVLPDLPVLVELEYDGARFSVHRAEGDPYPTARLRRPTSVAGAGFEEYLAIGNEDPVFVAGELRGDADHIEIEGAEVHAGPVWANGHWVAVLSALRQDRLIRVHEIVAGERSASSSLEV